MFFTKKKKSIYLDHAAGTAIDPQVLKKMMPYFTDQAFNPGAIYDGGFAVRDVLAGARKHIADAMSARPQEIIFTDGGTEANNLAIRGLVSVWRRNNPGETPHVITSNIEHASVLETYADLQKKNLAEISYISVDEHGILDIKELKKNITKNTILVSVGYVNGEIGVVQDIRAIAKTIRHYRKHQETHLPYFHTDAVQAVNYLDINVQKLGIDMMTINASKIYGPKKIAALYKKPNIEIDPMITGGNQEFGLRAGTENIPYIVGFAESLLLTRNLADTEYTRLTGLREITEKMLNDNMTLDFKINGQNAERIPNIINISIPELSSEEIVLRLAAAGMMASVKSACKSGEEGDSHVIRALRNNNTQSIRISIGRDTTQVDMGYFVDQLVCIVNEMKEVFDLYYKK